jgi:hypothetical protein
MDAGYYGIVKTPDSLLGMIFLLGVRSIFLASIRLPAMNG